MAPYAVSADTPCDIDLSNSGDTVRFLYTAYDDPAMAVGSWLMDEASEIAELRIQTGYFGRRALSVLAPSLARLAEDDRIVRVLLGANQQAISGDDVRAVLTAIAAPREHASLGLVSYRNALFHPKIYHLRRQDNSEAAYIGSANCTVEGLSGLNVEAGLLIDTRDDDPDVLTEVQRSFDYWFDTEPAGFVRVGATDDVSMLVSEGMLVDHSVPPIYASPGPEEEEGTREAPRRSRLISLPPYLGSTVRTESTSGVAEVEAQAYQTEGPLSYCMLLQQTDAGSGQTTSGAARRSPEIFIPLAAIRAESGFWGYPAKFTADPGKIGKMDRRGVIVSLDGRSIEVTMMTWPDRHDFRLRAAGLRDAASVGDILILTRADGPGPDYRARLVGPTDVGYQQALTRCTEAVRNSRKRFGYY